MKSEPIKQSGLNDWMENNWKLYSSQVYKIDNESPIRFYVNSLMKYRVLINSTIKYEGFSIDVALDTFNSLITKKHFTTK